MVDPGDVRRILLDAARLVRDGEVVVFGSAALAFWLEDAPRTRDVDIWCTPAERGELVEALMGELSWYHDKHDAYVEVWGPETFAAPSGWRQRAREFTDEAVVGVILRVPHPHDVLLAKVERWEEGDQDHARRILTQFPLDAGGLAELAAQSPYRSDDGFDAERSAAFEAHLLALEAMVG